MLSPEEKRMARERIRRTIETLTASMQTLTTAMRGLQMELDEQEREDARWQQHWDSQSTQRKKREEN